MSPYVLMSLEDYVRDGVRREGLRFRPAKSGRFPAQRRVFHCHGCCRHGGAAAIVQVSMHENHLRLPHVLLILPSLLHRRRPPRQLDPAI